MSEELKPCPVKHNAAKRCRDYDSDCAEVIDHTICWLGGDFNIEGDIVTLDPVEGYCPFVFGMEHQSQ